MQNVRLLLIGEIGIECFDVFRAFWQLQVRLWSAYRARVTVDSFPGETFEATVTRIADRADFTPRSFQTEEDHRTTVFAVELSVTAPGGKLEPGMPADVAFDLP